jgi:hypothetical protein
VIMTTTTTFILRSAKCQFKDGSDAMITCCLKTNVAWDVALCILRDVDRQFRRSYCFDHRGPHNGSRKRRSVSIRLQGTTSRKTDMIILAGMKMWDLASVLLGQGYRTPRGAVTHESGMMISRGNPKTGEKSFSAALSTTNVTLRQPRLNPSLRGEKPASSRHFFKSRWQWLRLVLNMLDNNKR